jgi:glyoxylase-like metal-dependent hydrolase (beta-lactamase superfamily II)
VSAGYHFNYEDAEPSALAGALAALAALPADRFVPGHGPPGGREILLAQARYHEEVARLAAAGPTSDEVREAIRAGFPGYLLEAAIETALGPRPPV